MLLSACVFVSKDLGNRWIDMVLHYSEAGPGKVYYNNGEGYLHPPKEIVPMKKALPNNQILS